jgi:single stranded DNA-binding protein
MASSLNKVQLIGHLGKDPESRSFQNGGKVVTFSVATSDRWTDKQSGERREQTQWHNVAIFNDALAEVATRFLKKGSYVYLEGQLEPAHGKRTARNATRPKWCCVLSAAIFACSTKPQAPNQANS